MSYYSRSIKSIVLVIIVSFGLSACQTISTAEVTAQTQGELDRIDIGEADSRLKQIFNRKLRDNLNQASALRDLELQTKLAVANSSTLAVIGESSNLSKTVMTLTYSLSDKLSNEALTSGTVQVTATSGTASSYYGQDASKVFAAERLTLQLADRLSLRLTRFFLEDDIKAAQ